MYDLLRGIKVIELAQWVMVPSATALLADMGADVVKVEHPVQGDPYRALRTSSLQGDSRQESPSVAHTNRGKRSLGLDVKTPEGADILRRLIVEADVFVTSLRNPALERLGLTADQATAINPGLVYVRGNAFGAEGPDADAPGFDATAFWSRGGFAHVLTPPGQDYPVQMRPALGDRTTAMALAMGVCAALTKRERSGTGSCIDVSLMGTAAWVLAGDMLAAVGGVDTGQEPGRSRSPNPLTNVFRTRDGRWIQLNGLQADRYWAELCRLIGREDLVADSRFADAAVRERHSAACLQELDSAFAGRDYDEWKSVLQAFSGPWAPVQGCTEVVADPQTTANHVIVELESDGSAAYAVAAPIQVQGGDWRLGRSPSQGEHTEEILLEMGITWEEISDLKGRGAIS